MWKSFKAWILRDVNNRNEASQGAITLRICSLVLITYLIFLTGTMLFTNNASLILFNIMFIALYGYLLWLTYCDMTKGALLWFNLATIGFVCFDVIYMELPTICYTVYQEAEIWKNPVLNKFCSKSHPPATLPLTRFAGSWKPLWLLPCAIPTQQYKRCGNPFLAKGMPPPWTNLWNI